MEKFFKLKENGTTVSTEIMAGITTFFAMAYIIAVNPSLLSSAGMEWGAVFLATIISSVIGTLIMGLVANVPYAQAPGMGLNAFFVYTVCFALEFTWQQALSMVFICGLINIFITSPEKHLSAPFVPTAAIICFFAIPASNIVILTSHCISFLSICLHIHRSFQRGNTVIQLKFLPVFDFTE